MPKTTDQILLEAIQDVRDDIARIDRDLGEERDANEKLAMAVNANTDQVGAFGKRLDKIEKRIQDRMSDAIAPLVESADNLITAIEDKRMVAEKMVKSKKRWFQFWRKRKEVK